MSVNCRGNHGLKQFKTSHRGYSCDACNRSMPKYTSMFGCRSCNYDLCSNCYSSLSSKMASKKKGSSSKLSSLFDKNYADKDENDIMSEEGMIKFFKDCGVNPEGHETLVIAFLLQCDEMGIYEKKEFCEGLSQLGCSSKSDIKKAVRSKLDAVSRNSREFKAFYKWLFIHVREDEKKKNIPTELALQLWPLALADQKRNLKFFGEWMAFCEEKQGSDMKSISKDVWEQVFDFLKETQSVDAYDEDMGWPVAIDEFVEWLKEKQ